MEPLIDILSTFMEKGKNYIVIKMITKPVLQYSLNTIPF